MQVSSDPVLQWCAAHSESAVRDGRTGLKEESQTKRCTPRRAEAVCSAPVRCICSLLNISRGTQAYHSLLSEFLVE